MKKTIEPHACVVGKQGNVTMRKAVEWLLQTNSTSGHWKPQSSFCELENRVQDYTFLGLYAQEKFGADAACLMTIAGIDKYNSIGSNNTPIWGAVDHSACKPFNFFHFEDKASEGEMMKKLFTPEAARNVIKAYKVDYITFQLPEPEWVPEATGELFDVAFAPVGAALQAHDSGRHNASHDICSPTSATEP